MTTPEQFEKLLDEYTESVDCSDIAGADSRTIELREKIILSYKSVYLRMETYDHLLTYSDLSC